MSKIKEFFSKGQWFSRARNRQSGIDFDALNQFVVALRSELDVFVSQLTTSGVEKPEVIGVIEAQLQEISENDSVEHNWSRAYHAEKLMLVLYNAEQIEIELLRRLDESKRVNAPFTPFYTAQMTERTGTGEAQSVDFALLLSMVRDLQWFNSRRYINMRYARLAIYKVGAVFVLSFASFLIVMSVGHWS